LKSSLRGYAASWRMRSAPVPWDWLSSESVRMQSRGYTDILLLRLESDLILESHLIYVDGGCTTLTCASEPPCRSATATATTTRLVNTCGNRRRCLWRASALRVRCTRGRRGPAPILAQNLEYTISIQEGWTSIYEGCMWSLAVGFRRGTISGYAVTTAVNSHDTRGGEPRELPLSTPHLLRVSAFLCQSSRQFRGASPIRNAGPERALNEETAVESHHVVSAVHAHGHHDRPDVSSVSRRRSDALSSRSACLGRSV
jgi:hypothetical protein